MSIFLSHGKFDVFTKQNIVYSTLEGPFNEQGVSRYIQHLKSVVTTEPSMLKTKVIRLIGQALLTPEAEATLSLQKLELDCLGFSEVIIVLEDAQYPNTAMVQWEKIFVGSYFKLKFKHTLNEAVEDLKLDEGTIKLIKGQ